MIRFHVYEAARRARLVVAHRKPELLGVLFGLLVAWLIACSHAKPPAPQKPITMGDELVCFFSRAEQKGEALICGESVLMCEAIRSEEYDRGAEVGPCTKRLVALSKE